VTPSPFHVDNSRIVATLLLRHNITGLALLAQQPAYRCVADIKQLSGLLVRPTPLRHVCRDDSSAQIDR